MTDYAGEQEMELEALEAILMDDLQVYDGNTPAGWVAVGETYKIAIDPTEDGEEMESEYPVKAELLVAHTPKYPDEPPSVRLRSVTGLSDADLAEGTALLNEQIQANLGMAMIYTLVGAAKEWIQGKAAGVEPEIDPDLASKQAAEEEEKRRAAARAHGTPVTVDTFNAWKASFDAEMALLKAKLAEQNKDDEKSRRLSGKQWFLQQQQAGVKDIDELDLEDEDVASDEDEDFHVEEVEDEEEEEEIDYEDDDDEDDDMLDKYLAEKKL